MKLVKCLPALCVLVSIAGAASAQDVIATVQKPWAGFYAGVNIGGAWNHTCQSFQPQNGIQNPAIANRFYNRDCPNNGNFIGGIQLGYNFQYNQWVWGFGADYDAVGSSSHNRAYAYNGATAAFPFPPNGTYTASGKTSPNGIGIIGPRIGYAFGDWLPYFRVGSAITGGQRTSSLTYTPTGGGPPATFSGGKNFKSSGFTAGFGVETALIGAWSFRAEYNYVNLGKGTNSVFTCTASPTVCATYSNISLDNAHNSFTMNLFRVGINYSFK
jgi:outer membrane immunogenic protein